MRRQAPFEKIFVTTSLISLAACAPAVTVAAQTSASTVGEQSTLFANPVGLLDANGISAALDYVGEGFTNRGGGQVCCVYTWENRLEIVAEADLERLAGLPDTEVRVRAYWLTGEGMSSRALGNRFTVSGLEAPPAVHFFDAWLERDFPERGISIRVGRLAADDEFMASYTAGNFINGTFGWPAIVALDLADGGPAYPTARPGVRVRYASEQGEALLVGVFELPDVNSAARPPSGKTDAHNPVILAEDQISVSRANAASDTVFKLGSWVQTGKVVARRDSHEGRGGWDLSSVGMYGVLDHILWHSAEDGESIETFVRVILTPRKDSPLAGYIDGGFGITGLPQSRPADYFGIAVAYGEVRGSVPTVEQRGRAVGLHELVFEMSYIAHVSSWCALQPDLQYLRYGALANGSLQVDSALVLGVRANLRFW